MLNVLLSVVYSPERSGIGGSVVPCASELRVAGSIPVTRFRTDPMVLSPMEHLLRR
jgi:hypothetical protein